MVNKVILIGNLTRDPESRNTQNGDMIVHLSMATNERWKDKTTGERREKVEYHRVVIFNPHLGQVAVDYLKKGSQCYVSGSLQTRKWTDSQGQDKYSTEVVLQRFNGELTLLGGRQGGQERSQEQPGPSGGTTPGLDDEIPFAPQWR